MKREKHLDYGALDNICTDASANRSFENAAGTIDPAVSSPVAQGK